MKRITFYVHICMLTAAMVACKNKSSPNYHEAVREVMDSMPKTPTKDMNVGKESYSLYIPQGWTSAHSTYAGINYYTIGAPKTETDPNTNVNVITEYMHNLSLEIFQEKTIEYLKRSIPSVFVTGEGDIVANRIKGSWYSYTMEPAGIKVSIVSYIFPKGGVAYCITAGTQQKDAEHYRSTFDSIAKSFKFSE